MREIFRATNSKIRIRGRGSGHLEVPTPNGRGKEAPVPLMVAVTANKAEPHNSRHAVDLILVKLLAVNEHCRQFCIQRDMPAPTQPLFSFGEVAACAARQLDDLVRRYPHRGGAQAPGAPVPPGLQDTARQAGTRSPSPNPSCGHGSDPETKPSANSYVARHPLQLHADVQPEWRHAAITLVQQQQLQWLVAQQQQQQWLMAQQHQWQWLPAQQHQQAWLVAQQQQHQQHRWQWQPAEHQQGGQQDSAAVAQQLQLGLPLLLPEGVQRQSVRQEPPPRPFLDPDDEDLQLCIEAEVNEFLQQRC